MTLAHAWAVALPVCVLYPGRGPTPAQLLAAALKAALGPAGISNTISNTITSVTVAMGEDRGKLMMKGTNTGSLVVHTAFCKLPAYSATAWVHADSCSRYDLRKSDRLAHRDCIWNWSPPAVTDFACDGASDNTMSACKPPAKL